MNLDTVTSSQFSAANRNILAYFPVVIAAIFYWALVCMLIG